MRRVVVLFGILAAGVPAGAQQASPPRPPATNGQAAVGAGALARMPVREVTVFKDGNAFVLHEGAVATDGGNVVLDYLPSPVLGTFWPYSAEKDAKLTAVVAGKRRLKVERTALNLRELLEANVGAAVTVREVDKTRYDATILGFLTRSGEELQATAPPNIGELLPVKSDLILLKTGEGTRAVPIQRIQDVTFKGTPRSRTSDEEFRNLLTLKLDWGGKPASKQADIGMIYLQRGIRWIPQYRISLDGGGKATVKLQATLVNELTDLRDVTANLVVGVPSFQFQDTPDPIGIQETAAQLGRAFERGARTQFGLSNAIMSQTAGEFRGGRAPAAVEQPGPVDLGPEVGGTERTEDLYVFSVKHVTLKKGERMVLPVTEFSVPYKDVFRLELPFGPPRELSGSVSGEQQAELARLLAKPKVMHHVRLSNKSPHPFTTAPALMVRGERVLAQGMMTYAAPGADVDVPLTASVDIRVKKEDVETGRQPNAARYGGYELKLVKLEGTVQLQSFRTAPVEVEVVRYLLGGVDAAENGGKVEMLNVVEDDTLTGVARPHWWGWYSWPAWWNQYNGLARITWNVPLEPRQEAVLKYRWHYYAP